MTTKTRMSKMLAATTVALLAGATYAQGTFHEDTRDAELSARIDQGRASGSLTPREADHLRHEASYIKHVEWQDKRDGVVTANEREHVRVMQDHLSQDISRDKHNDRNDYNRSDYDDRGDYTR